MPLPAGFKVNGLKVTSENRTPVPPRVQKIMALLETVPKTELLTSAELCERLGMGIGGSFINHPALIGYKEKVDNKLFWGSRASIAQLRKQLVEPEETV